MQKMNPYIKILKIEVKFKNIVIVEITKLIILPAYRLYIIRVSEESLIFAIVDSRLLLLVA